MAKEMMIVFIYDTEYCQKESDDPVNAVLYFHPSWVSDVQKLSLCGQLMGTCHFLSDTFFRPKSISLQSGKFILKNFNRFILAVGTDRNIADSILEHRASLLESLVNLYHCDIQTICEQFNVNQTKNLSEKLYHIFETYLPILQYNGNLFQNIPTLRLPKSSNTNYLEAMQTLQGCQQLDGVLGGTIIYHNKVVATQLSSDLTKILVTTDPHRNKSTTDHINVNFHIPNGVQLINVYVKTSEYQNLKKLSDRTRSAFANVKANNLNAAIPAEAVAIPAPLIPFSLKKKINIIKEPATKSSMKRDQSLIFTNIPEEEANSPTGETQKNNKKFNRPNHLPLRFKNMTAKELPESGFHSINFDETDSFPNFIGKTSICSTPMTENKILPSNLASFIANQNLAIKAETENAPKTVEDEPENKVDSVITTVDRQWNSWSGKDSDNLSKISDDVEIAEENSMDNNSKRSNSITDPTFPIFTNRGKPLSKKSYDDYIMYKYKATNLNSSRKLSHLKDFDQFDGDKNNSQENDDNRRKSIHTLPLSKLSEEDNKNSIKANNEIKRKLSLPIKSLTLDLNSNSSGVASVKNSTIFDSPARRKKLGGIQLTPLMAKLTILAASSNDDRSSGFSSFDTTPGYAGGAIPSDLLLTPIDIKTFNYKRKPSLSALDTKENNEGDADGANAFKKVDLFVCGQQNMTMLLIMEANSSGTQDLIQSLFETCIAKLTKIESNLNQVLNINVENVDKGEGSYSFICVDPRWDIVHRGGPWSPSDLNSLEYMHRDFHENFNFTEMILRGDDSVIYGYQCGRSEVFYQQSAVRQSGLPPPADAMGTVQLCAKRRLERDHSILIL